MGDEAHAPRSYAPVMQARAGSLALASVAAVASLSGCGHASRSSASAATPPAYSVHRVEAAFAAAGLPLTIAERAGGVVDLTSRSYVDTVGGDFMVAVTVLPPSMDGGESLSYPAADALVSVHNVSVRFDPVSSSAGQVRAAVARLRRT